MKNACIFCQIISGKVPSKIIHENKHAMAIMTLEQEVPGHIIIFSKKHFASLEDADQQSMLEIMKMVKAVGKHILATGYNSYNLLSADGEQAGQSVPHFHIHFIPRRENDGINAWPDFDYKGDINGDDVFQKLRF